MSLTRLRQFWDRLVEPYSPIPNDDQADRARLLAGLSLLALLVALGLPTVLTIDSTLEARPWQWLTIVICWAGLGLLYHQARLGRTQVPVIAVIVGAITAIYISPAYTPADLAIIGLYYVMEIILFAAMFMSVRFTLSLALVSLVVMLLLPLVHHNLSFIAVLQGPANFTFFMSVIIALYIRYRRQTDERRRQRLTESEERYRRISQVTSDYAFSYRLEPDGSMVEEWSTDPLPGVPENIALILNAASEKVRLLDAEESVVISTNLATLLGSQTGERNYRLRFADGADHWVRIYQYPVWSDTEQRVTHVYGAVKDITENKQAEVTRRQFKRHQERLSEINELTEAVSHDFRTSLASIATNRYLLGHRLANDPDSLRRLDTIQQMVDHMAEQLDKFKHMASLVQPNLYPVEINQLVKQVVENNQKRAQAKALELHFVPDPSLRLVQIDSSEIERAVRYLLDNALAYTPAGGSVEVRTRLAGDNAQIVVQDTGLGIPAEALDRIYDFFYRADPARSTESGGVGMGLSLVKMIAEAHSGSIQVESTVGVGSTFTLGLPISMSDHTPGNVFTRALAAD
jgi:signal transduction histidine kinase